MHDDDEDDMVFMKRNVWGAIACQAISLVLLVGIVCVFATKNPSLTRILHFGPGTASNPIEILGVNVNTKTKYIALMCWLVVSEALATYSYKVYKNWYRSYLLNPHCTEVGMSKGAALFAVNTFQLISFIPKIFKVLLTILTLQVQFLLVSFVTRRVVSTAVDANHLATKEKKKQSKQK